MNRKANSDDVAFEETVWWRNLLKNKWILQLTDQIISKQTLCETFNMRVTQGLWFEDCV